MILRSSNGETFELTLLGYEGDAHVADRYDRNWLRVRIGATDRGAEWGGESRVLAWEIPELVSWLRDQASESMEVAGGEIYFVEPDFDIESVYGRPEVLLRVATRYELSGAVDGSDPESRRVVNLMLFPQMLKDAADDLAAEGTRYPER